MWRYDWGGVVYFPALISSMYALSSANHTVIILVWSLSCPCLKAGSTAVNTLNHLGVGSASVQWYLNHSSWNSWVSLFVGSCWYCAENAVLVSSPVCICLSISIGNLLGKKLSHFFLYSSSSSAIALITSFSRLSHHFFSASSRYQHKSSSCILCIIITIAHSTLLLSLEYIVL